MAQKINTIIGVDEFKRLLVRVNVDLSSKPLREVAYNSLAPYRERMRAHILSSGHNRRGTLPETIHRRTSPRGREALLISIGMNNKAPQAVLIAEQSRRNDWQSIVPNPSWLDKGASGAKAKALRNEGKAKLLTESVVSKSGQGRVVTGDRYMFGRYKGIIQGTKFISNFRDTELPRAGEELRDGIARYLVEVANSND